MTRCAAREKGFALLMTLLLVLLAAVALAGLARHSAVQAVQAQRAEADLQRRWAVQSMRRALLPRIDAVFAQAENEATMASAASTDRSPSEQRTTCRLVGGTYELVLTDEQAKVNVNHLMEVGGDAGAAAALRRLTSGLPNAGAVPVQVQLRPLADRAPRRERSSRAPAVVGYDQVFTGIDPAELVGRRIGQGAASHITCWGNGRVNLRRAADEVIRITLAQTDAAPVAASLLRTMDERLIRSVEQLARIEGLNDDQQSAVRRSFADESSCHGLWIIADDGRQQWYSFSVVARGVDGRLQQRLDFSW